MSGRMHPKQARAWDRVSPGRRQLPSDERGTAEHFHLMETGSPDRFKRGRWESPPRNRMDSPNRLQRREFESPPRPGRYDMMLSPRARRGGFDDGRMPLHGLEEDYQLRPMNQEAHREARPPAGLVFLCSSASFRECFHFRVFGLPAAQREVVERVVPGTKLFLFNFDTKELFGVFEAASRGGLNLVPEAFSESKGTYAAQVRFTILREALPLADDIVSDVLRENFSQRGKFDCELSADQVVKILQLFSRQELRPVVSTPERGRIGQESRNMALGINGIDPEGRHLSLPGLDPQFLMNRPLLDGGPPPDPAVILGGAMIEEADQLALKYLQNNPAIAGIRLEPVNISLLSSSLRNNAQPSFSSPPMDHDQGGFTASSLQPNGVPFPAGRNSRLLGLPGSSVPDPDRIEHPGADGGKMFGQFMPERGLLPIPPVQHHIPSMPSVNQPGFPPSLPNQPSMIRSFPPTGPFPLPVGPLGGVPPEFGGPHLPFYPLQGAPRMPFQGAPGMPPHLLGNPSQVGGVHQGGNRPNNRQLPNSKVGIKSKKNKQKKRFKHQKVLGGGDKSEKNDDAAAEAPEDEAPEAPEVAEA